MITQPQTVSEQDGELEIRATVQHGPHAAPGSIAFYRSGTFIMSIARDSPRATRWTWDLPARERPRWIELARRVAAAADRVAERARLADRPI